VLHATCSDAHAAQIGHVDDRFYDYAIASTVCQGQR